MAPAVLGEDCSKTWTDSDVRGRYVPPSLTPSVISYHYLMDGLTSPPRSTLDKAYTALLTSYENTASDHDSLASALLADVADPLKNLERSRDESRKRQMAFFAKLVGERDRVYGERLKAKQKVRLDEVEGLKGELMTLGSMMRNARRLRRLGRSR